MGKFYQKLILEFEIINVLDVMAGVIPKILIEFSVVQRLMLEISHILNYCPVGQKDGRDRNINKNKNISIYCSLSQRPALTDGLSLNGTSLHQLRFSRTTNHKVRLSQHLPGNRTMAITSICLKIPTTIKIVC